MPYVSPLNSVNKHFHQLILFFNIKKIIYEKYLFVYDIKIVRNNLWNIYIETIC